MAGRPTLLTSNLSRRFCSAIGKGASLSKACEFVGISRTTLYDWFEKAEEAEDEDDIYLQFKLAVDNARAKLFIELVDVLKTAALENKDTKAAETLLKGRFGSDFGGQNINVNVDHTGKVQHELTLSDKLNALFERVSEDQIDAIVTELVGRGEESLQLPSPKISSAEEVSTVYQSDVSELQGDGAQHSDSGRAGTSSEWDVQEADYRDASETWEVSGV